MKPVFYFTVSRKELRPSEMPDGMPLLLSAASFLAERKNGTSHLFPPAISPAMFPVRGADCGGFVATIRWSARYRYQPAQYIQWLFAWKPQWAASFDLCCFNPQFTNDRLSLVYPGPDEVKARQQYTTKMAELFWIHARSVPWSWTPTIHGYFSHEYEAHARQLAPLIRQMYAWYSDPSTQEEDDEVSAFRVGVGSLASRARPSFVLDVLDRIQGILGSDIPLHLWGVKLKTLQAGITLPGVVSLDTGAWNGLFGYEHEKRRASGLSVVEYSWRTSQPYYEQRVHQALHAPQQIPLSFFSDDVADRVPGSVIAHAVGEAIAYEDEEHDQLLQDAISPLQHSALRSFSMLSLQIQPFLTQLSQGEGWTPWVPLLDSWKQFHKTPGLYRIRLNCMENWLYLGQTTSLASRMQMLKGAFDEHMPYAAPHVAGPALYAYRHLYPQATLEVSVCEIDVSEQMRLALECFVIALHRQEHQHSPLCQFGRMPVGWQGSSGNSAKLVEMGKRFRGGSTNEENASHLPDIAPLSVLKGDPHSSTWFAQSWSPRMTAATALSQCENTNPAEGLYRIRSAPGTPVVFLGQGKIKQRLAEYKKRDVSCSWVTGAWHPHQRLALVVDLIGSHLLTMEELPQEQFVKSHPSFVKSQSAIFSTLTSLLLA